MSSARVSRDGSVSRDVPSTAGGERTLSGRGPRGRGVRVSSVVAQEQLFRSVMWKGVRHPLTECETSGCFWVLERQRTQVPDLRDESGAATRPRAPSEIATLLKQPKLIGVISVKAFRGIQDSEASVEVGLLWRQPSPFAPSGGLQVISPPSGGVSVQDRPATTDVMGRRLHSARVTAPP
ncbi:unnamed protein product [Arctogadus glacialis]